MNDSELAYRARLTARLAQQLQAHHSDSWRPQWHVSAPLGLINDPNGFCYFEGRYQLFFQWNPWACSHGAKAWGHVSSDDLIHWQHQPLALAPTEDFEKDGCYSGSAIVKDGQLYLFYTGNVKLPAGQRTAYQCMAVREQEGRWRKLGPVIELPEGYTGHVRDPKVWLHQGSYYMVLGAQTLERQGVILLYASSDLKSWLLRGEIAGSQRNGLGDFGYMWECPDLFSLGDRSFCSVAPRG